MDIQLKVTDRDITGNYTATELFDILANIHK